MSTLKAQFVFGKKYNKDYSGFGNQLLINGASPINHFKPYKYFASSFVNNGYFYIANASNFNVLTGESFTAVLFVKAYNMSTDRIFSIISSSRTNGLELFSNGSNGLSIFINTATSGSISLANFVPSNTLTDKITKITLRFDYGNFIKIYLDDVLINTSTAVTTITGDLFNNQKLWIGNGFNGLLPFSGIISDLIFFNGLVSESDCNNIKSLSKKSCIAFSESSL